ncbi:aspartate aminotransferase family protein, partial [Chroococcidiopsis cubana CCALA 043]
MTIDTLISNHNLSVSAATVVKSFDSDNFKESVMDTYARFPIALERGAGCRVW